MSAQETPSTDTVTDTACEQGATGSSDADNTSKIQEDRHKRSFTIKSILFGVLGLLITIWITGPNEEVLRQTPFVGHHFPSGPYFLILCIALIWNPLWARLHDKLCLKPRELVVSLLIILVGCWTAGSGLNRFFTHAVIAPWVKYENQTSWQSAESIHYIPQHLFPLGGKNYIYTIDVEDIGTDRSAFIKALHAASHISVGDIETQLQKGDMHFEAALSSDTEKKLQRTCQAIKSTIITTKQIHSVVKISKIDDKHKADILSSIKAFTQWDDAQIQAQVAFNDGACSFEFTGDASTRDVFEDTLLALNVGTRFEIRDGDKHSYQIGAQETDAIQAALSKHQLTWSPSIHVPAKTIDALKEEIAALDPSVPFDRIVENDIHIENIKNSGDIIDKAILGLTAWNQEQIKGLHVDGAINFTFRASQKRFSEFKERISADNMNVYVGDMNKITYDNFYSGLPAEADVPYSAWAQPLSSWLPLLIVFSICIISLSLLVHRQWSSHEQLTYPLAQIGTSLLERKSGNGLPDLFRKRSFWVACIFVFGFHFIRLLNAWYPNAVPGISYTANFSNFFWETFPTIGKAGAAFWLNQFTFFFSIIGITYFLSREIGLTLGISNMLLSLVGVQIFLHTGNSLTAADHSNTRAGGYMAYAAVILFTGRHYYWSIFKKALTFRSGSEEETDGIFAARILMLSFVGLIIIMSVSFELNVSIAFFYALLTLLLFMVFARITCETGIPFLQTGWQPSVIIAKIFGVSAIGAAPLVIMYYMSLVLSQDPKECFMPYIANGLKLADNYKMKLKKIAIMAMIVVTCAICLSIFTRMTQHYTAGANASFDTYGKSNTTVSAFSSATEDIKMLKSIGRIDEPGAASHELEFSHIKPDAATMKFVLFGAFGVIIFFLFRFRFTGFPLHPVLFLVWGCYPISRTFWSFLIGWGIRELIVRFGGGSVYQQCKPFFIGLIVGELFAGMLGISVGLLCNTITGNRPADFDVFIR